MFQITGITPTRSLATQEQLMYNKYSSEGQQAAGLGQLTAHFLWNLIWCSEFWHSSAGPDGIRHRHTVTSCKCWTQLSNVVTIIISTHPSELVNSPCEVQMVWEATPMSGTTIAYNLFTNLLQLGDNTATGMCGWSLSSSTPALAFLSPLCHLFYRFIWSSKSRAASRLLLFTGSL